MTRGAAMVAISKASASAVKPSRTPRRGWITPCMLQPSSITGAGLIGGKSGPRTRGLQNVRNVGVVGRTARLRPGNVAGERREGAEVDGGQGACFRQAGIDHLI